MEWDDLRFVLAVARTGSASRAARELGVDQTTVLRKLDLLETTVGTSLFERRKTGQTPTPAGKLVAEAAERMEKEVRALENTLATRRRICRRRSAPNNERRPGDALRHTVHARVSFALSRRVGRADRH